MSSGWVASERLVEHGAGRVEVGLVAGVVGGCAAATGVSARIDRMQLEALAVVDDPGGFAPVEDAEAHLDGPSAQKALVDLEELALKREGRVGFDPALIPGDKRPAQRLLAAGRAPVGALVPKDLGGVLPISPEWGAR